MAKIHVTTLVLPALALVGGLVLGGLGPRAQVRALQQEVSDLKHRAAHQTSPIGQGIDALLNTGRAMPSQDAGQPPASGPISLAPGASEEPPTGDGTVASEGHDASQSSAVRDGVGSASTPAAMRDMLDVRAASARAALIDKARPSPSQLQEIDDAVDDLNESLRLRAVTWVQQLDGAEPSRRDIMTFAADALGDLVDAEDRVLDILTPSQRMALAPDDTDPTTFIDGRVADAISDLVASGGY